MDRNLPIFISAAIFSVPLVVATSCCTRPLSAWAQTSLVPKDELPGLVVIVDRDHQVASCVGTVVKTIARSGGFDNYVLTARHCVIRNKERVFRQGIVRTVERVNRIGVAIPSSNDNINRVRSTITDATIAYISHEPRTVGGVKLNFTTSTIDWDQGDWVILVARSTVAWTSVPIFRGDPAEMVQFGSPVSLRAFTDIAFDDFHARSFPLRPHEHPFRWAGVPRALIQGGHSGAPIVYDGQVIAIFSGDRENSYACKLMTGSTWPAKLTFVSVAVIRTQARAQGLEL